MEATKSEPVENKANVSPDIDTRCGIFNWKPNYLQKYANPRVYLVFFSIVGILQGAYFAYLIGVLSTIEKRFSFRSKVSGLILIADNVTPIFTSTFIGYYGGKTDRPKWTAAGMLTVVVSCFLSCLPYLIFGSAENEDVLKNVTTTEICDMEPKSKNCEKGETSSTVPAVSCFVIASAIKGFGATAFYTLGISYLDDNVEKKQSPLYLGVTYTLRILGPTFGFLLSSLCLRYYEYPWYEPGFTKEDPRWIGAWWIGFVVLGFGLLIFSIPLFFFPRVLPGTKTLETIEEEEDGETISTIKDLALAVLRVLKNPVIFWYNLGGIFICIGWFGHYTFLPKYFETQFGKSASDANLYSGPVVLICMQIGIMSGALILRKWKPKPQYIAVSVVAVDLLGGIVLFGLTMMGCPQIKMMGTDWKDGELQLGNDCNKKCLCSVGRFEPICGQSSGSTYFSPCFAGCTEYNKTNYENCRCVHDEKGNFIVSGTVPQYCPQPCDKIISYSIILGIIRIISSFNSVGGTLLFFRAVSPKDKSLALGVVEALYSLFVFIPYPLIFGAISDAACLLWEEKCGKTGNCWIYDADKFRYYLHITASALICLGVFSEIAVIYYSKNIKDFYEDEKKERRSMRRRSNSLRFSNTSIRRTYSIS